MNLPLHFYSFYYLLNKFQYIDVIIFAFGEIQSRNLGIVNIRGYAISVIFKLQFQLKLNISEIRLCQYILQIRRKDNSSDFLMLMNQSHIMNYVLTFAEEQDLQSKSKVILQSTSEGMMKIIDKYEQKNISCTLLCTIQEEILEQQSFVINYGTFQKLLKLINYKSIQNFGTISEDREYFNQFE
ncbi:hypothetical protein FGO68_gene3391 [Halteria grandinella]|uniref:Uncharacterized protein n=1 Tax=Halteria grandinella TaxID=5974 RepID=A0A8J8NFE5_HALGN|nr:hypothetical protein FGO68_gene3391 [Halteria grandinella]